MNDLLVPTNLSLESNQCAPLTDATATEVALLAIVQSLLHNTLSGDVIFLSMFAAHDLAIKHGCTQEQYQRVQTRILEEWQTQSGRNPLKGLFE